MTSLKRKISEFSRADEHPTPENSSRPYKTVRLSSPPLPPSPPSSSREQTLPYFPPQNNTNSRPPPPPQTPFQQPTPLLTFSYTPSRTLELNDSALRYFVDPPRGAQLGYGYERWVRKPEERGRVDGLLKAWSKIRNSGPGGIEVGVVAWRGVITKILTGPYEEREGWELNVMCIEGTMYFEEHLSEARLKEKNEMEPRHRLQSYYGYAFESYCTTDTPHHNASVHMNDNNNVRRDPPGWGGDVDTNVQWCSVVRTKLGDTRMVIGGEVDCVRGKYTGKTDTFVELKTSMVIRGPHDEPKFEKKLLKFYFQSFLLGVPEILVGFRTPSGQVTTTQSFKTIQIPRLVRGKQGAWDPLVCLDWGHRFLTFLKGVVHGSDHTKETDDKQNADEDRTNTTDDKDRTGTNAPVTVWRVKFVPKVGVSVEILDRAGVEDVEGGEDRVGFLPRWYWEDVERGPDGPRHDDASASNASSRKSGGDRTQVPRGASGEAKPLEAPVNAGWQI